jgi:flagellar biosynthesis protein FlhG
MRLITFGSGEAGAGTSVLAANLGLALAREGVRTCLVDLDLATGDLHLLLGATRGVLSMDEVIADGGASMAQASTPVPGAAGLALVPGVRETVSASSLSPGEIAGLARGLRTLDADVVLVDLPGGIAPQIFDLFLSGDETVLVAEPGHRGARAAARFLRLARLRRSSREVPAASSDPAKPRVYTSLEDLVDDMNTIREGEEAVSSAYEPRVVLNRCRSAGAARERFLPVMADALGEDFRLEVIAEIPEDPWVRRSVEMLSPVVDLAPECGATTAIRALARELGAIPV